MEINPGKRVQEGASLPKAPAVYFPVNTLMLREAGLTPGEEFLLDGQQVELVKLTCRIPEIHEGSQCFEFKFADEFGSFKGILYRPSIGTARPLRHFNLSTYHFSDYVTVVGHLRKFPSLAWLVVDSLEEVQSYDEVLQHRAQVLWAWVQRRGKLPELPKSEVRRDRPQNIEKKADFTHLQELQQDILRSLKKLMSTQKSTLEGVSKTELLGELRFKPQDKEYQRALDTLLLNGSLVAVDNGYIPAS